MRQTSNILRSLFLAALCALGIQSATAETTVSASSLSEEVQGWQPVANLTDLKALKPDRAAFTHTLGHTTKGDGGAADWYYSTSSTATDNSSNGVGLVTIVKPTSVTGAGRWLLRSQSIGTAGDFRTFATIALLKAGVATQDGEVVNVTCYYTCTTPDGGGGLFKWDSTSSATDNGGTIIAPDAGGVGRWRRFGYEHITPLMFGAKGDNGITNDAAAFTAALAAADEVFVPQSSTIDVNTGQSVYRLDSEIRVMDDQKLMLARGVILKRFSASSAATTPVVTGLGIGFEIYGGTIQTQNASPSGVVRLGNLDSTDARNAHWWRFENTTVLGRTAVAAGDIGVYVPSGQITDPAKANYFGTISNINIQNADLGLFLDEFANAHNVSKIQYWNIRTACLRLKGNYANQVISQFFHAGFANGVIAVDIRNKSAGTQDPVANSVIGFTVETLGTADIPVFLDTASAHNIVIGNANTTTALTNNATGTNTVLLGMTGALYQIPTALTVRPPSGRAVVKSGGTNVGLSLSSQGSGTIQLLTNNEAALQVEILHTSLSANALNLTGAVAGGNPTVSTSAGDLKLNSAGGNIQWGPALITLGGGATPTLGTIGGAGPATAAQNTWMQVKDSTGATFWVPAWK